MCITFLTSKSLHSVFSFCIAGDSVVPIATPVAVVGVVFIIAITLAVVSIAVFFLKNRHGDSSTGK